VSDGEGGRLGEKGFSFGLKEEKAENKEDMIEPFGEDVEEALLDPVEEVEGRFGKDDVAVREERVKWVFDCRRVEARDP